MERETDLACSTRIAFTLLLVAGLSAQQTVSLLRHRHRRSPRQLLQLRPAHGLRIAGTVVNSLTGQPVSAASVAIAPTSEGTDRDISKSVTTGADGKFSVYRTGPDQVLADGQLRADFRCNTSNTTILSPSAIAVGPDLDSRSPGFPPATRRSIEGQVSDENNDPIQNALVRLFQTTTEEGQQKTAPMTQAQTDDLGQYRIGHLVAWNLLSCRCRLGLGTRRTRAHRRTTSDITRLFFQLAERGAGRCRPRRHLSSDVLWRVIRLRQRHPANAERGRDERPPTSPCMRYLRCICAFIPAPMSLPFWAGWSSPASRSASFRAIWTPSSMRRIPGLRRE